MYVCSKMITSLFTMKYKVMPIRAKYWHKPVTQEWIPCVTALKMGYDIKHDSIMLKQCKHACLSMQPQLYGHLHIGLTSTKISIEKYW